MGERTCSIEGCESPHLARGWCSRHYQRWQRRGDPSAPSIPRPLCSVEGCERPNKGYGWCNKHYQRWKVNGTVDRPRQSVEQRFWAKVNTDGPAPQYRPDLGQCWLWDGALNAAGYGNFGIAAGHNIGAHRFAYEQLVGAVPDGMELDHLCRVRACCNPAHLEPVTSAENKRRSPLLPPRVNARKTHCPKGHPYDEANTYWRRGWRACRACNRATQAAYLARKRGSA